MPRNCVTTKKLKFKYTKIIPKSIDERQYSGRISLRVPKTLHAILAMEAEKEGVSLNQYVLYRLST